MYIGKKHAALKKKYKFQIIEDLDTKKSIQKTLLLKDTNNISDKSYHCFRGGLGLKHLLPKIDDIRACRKELNSQFQINRNEFGMFINIKERIKSLKINKNHLNDNKLLIKFSGDGTIINKTLKLLNFTFSIMSKNSKCTSSAGHFIVGMFKIDKENYEQLKDCLNEIFIQIEQLNEIEIDNDIFETELFLSCDLKFQALLSGINSANAEYPCVWCKAPIYTRTLTSADKKNYDIELKKEWSCFLTTNGARTHEDSENILNQIQLAKTQARKSKNLKKIEPKGITDIYIAIIK